MFISVEKMLPIFFTVEFFSLSMGSYYVCSIQDKSITDFSLSFLSFLLS